MSSDAEHRHPARDGEGVVGISPSGHSVRKYAPSTQAAGRIPHSPRSGVQQDRTSNPRALPVAAARRTVSRNRSDGSQISRHVRVARRLLRYGCAMLIVQRAESPQSAADARSNRAASASGGSPGRSGSNRHRTREGPILSESRRKAETASLNGGTEGSNSLGNPVRVNWKIDRYPSRSNRSSAGRNGTGLRVQNTKAATSFFRRETVAGRPEYGFRYSA